MTGWVLSRYGAYEIGLEEVAGCGGGLGQGEG